MNALILLTIFIGLFAISLLSFLLLEYHRRDRLKTRAFFISDDGFITIKKYKDVDKKISYKEKTYLYDKDAALKKNKSEYIFFRTGNPYPLKINDKTGKLKFTSSNLESLLDENITNKLFKNEDKNLKLIKMLLIAALGGIAVMLFFMFTGEQTAVSIASEENAAFIAEAIKNALR